MLLVKLIDQFLHIPDILRRFLASPYITVTHLLYQIMQLPVVSLGVEDPVDFPFPQSSRRPSTPVKMAAGLRWKVCCSRAKRLEKCFTSGSSTEDLIHQHSH